MDNPKSSVSLSYQQNTKNAILWISFLVASFLVYMLLSSGDYSFLLTFAAFMRCFGILLLNVKMLASKSVKGISIKTLEVYSIIFCSRLLSILRHQGYLPYDKTGDWFYHVVEILSLIGIISSIYQLMIPLKFTYDEKYDQFGNLHIPNKFGALYIIIPCVILAMMFHPSLNHEFFSDTCWTLSMYLESLAMLPQLYMFQKQASAEGGTIDNITGHMVFALGFSRVFEFIFWVSSFTELVHHTGSRISGYMVLISQLIQLGIMGDFFYYYVKSLAVGIPLVLPPSNVAYGNV